MIIFSMEIGEIGGCSIGLVKQSKDGMYWNLFKKKKIMYFELIVYERYTVILESTGNSTLL